MKKTNRLQKTMTTFLMLVLGLQANAQLTLFEEDFEKPTVTSMVNVFSGDLQTGSSSCGFAGKGDISDHFSLNVDFNMFQNFGNYVALNPESPCGGYNFADLESGTLDLSSGTDSVIFTADYYITSTLAWGPGVLSVVFNDGSTDFTVDTEFSSTDTWDNVSVKLPSSFSSANVTFTIVMGGGEGVALDNFKLTGYDLSTALQTNQTPQVTVGPNPTSGSVNINLGSQKEEVTVSVIDMLGSAVHKSNYSQSELINLDLDVPSGVYFLTVEYDNQVSSSKIIIQ